MNEQLAMLARAADDAGNYDEAYAYWTRVLEADPDNPDAWLGKALAAGWQSKLGRLRFAETVQGCDKALRLSSPDQHEAMAERAKDEIKSMVLGYYKMAVEHFEEFRTVSGTRDEHIERCTALYGLLQAAERYVPNDPMVTRISISVIESATSMHDENGKLRAWVTSPEARALWDARAGLIAKMQKLDLSYKPTVFNTSSGEAGCVLWTLVFLAAIAALIYGVIWLFHAAKG